MIEKEVLVSLIEEGLSISKIGKRVNKCNNSVCHWLRKYNLKTKIPQGGNKDWANMTEHKCSICKTVKPINEFLPRGRGGRLSYCQPCLKTRKKTGSLRYIPLTPSIKNELDKCVCLCSNCHREVHGGITTIPQQ